MRYDLVAVRIACREVRRACAKAQASAAQALAMTRATAARIRGERGSRLS